MVEILSGIITLICGGIVLTGLGLLAHLIIEVSEF